jgi:hypothetical protein
MGAAGCATKDQDRASLGQGREIEEVADVYAETKIEELAEGKVRLEKPSSSRSWDKIQRRERQTKNDRFRVAGSERC